MKASLQPGLTFDFAFQIPESKTVPYLYPESREFQAMPEVFATGFMVGLIEWTCIQAVNTHIHWPDEQTVGVHINVSHMAATPPGLIVVVKSTLEKVDGRRLTFSIVADDGTDTISQGTHERCIIDCRRFKSRVARKQADALKNIS